MDHDQILDYFAAKPRVSAKPAVDQMLNQWYLEVSKSARAETVQIASIAGFTQKAAGQTVYSPVRAMLTDVVYVLIEQARFTPEVDRMLDFMQFESPIDYFWRRMDMFGFIVTGFVHGVSLRPFKNDDPVTYAEVAITIEYLDARTLGRQSYVQQRLGMTAKHLQDDKLRKQLNEMISIATDQLRIHARLLSAKLEGDKERGA